jgi:hypothetical protein
MVKYESREKLRKEPLSVKEAEHEDWEMSA